jgi:hypothetical protein
MVAYYTTSSTTYYDPRGSTYATGAVPPFVQGSKYPPGVDAPTGLKVLNKDALRKIGEGRGLSLKEDSAYTADVNPYNQRLSPTVTYVESMALVNSHPEVFSYEDERFGSQDLRRFIALDIPIDLLSLPGALSFNGTVFQTTNGRSGVQMNTIKVRALPKILNLYNNRYIKRNSNPSEYTRTVKRDGVTLYAWVDAPGNIQFAGKYLLNPEEATLAKQVLEMMPRERIADLKKYLRDFTAVFEYTSPDVLSKVKHTSRALTLIALVRLSDGDTIPAHGRTLGSALNFLWKDEPLQESSDLTNVEGEIWTMPGGVMAKVYTEWYEGVRDIDIIQGESL